MDGGLSCFANTYMYLMVSCLIFPVSCKEIKPVLKQMVQNTGRNNGEMKKF